MFMQRPMEFKSTDLGFMEYTKYFNSIYALWAFLVRCKGKIFKLDQNGQGLEVISEIVNGKPSSMKSWFRSFL